MEWLIPLLTEFSIKTPPIFLSSTYISLGHFTDTPIPSFLKQYTIESDTHLFKTNCIDVGIKTGFMYIENVRFSFGLLCHKLPRCPLPSFW